MFSSNDGISIPTLTGPNYLSWAPKMCAYLQAKGFWFAIRNECPAPATEDEDTKAIEHWDDGNDQAIDYLILRMDNHITNKYSIMETAKEIWDDLETQYSKPSIASVYMEFKALIDTNIPDGNHPALAFMKLTAHFQCLKEFKFEVSKEIQVLLILAKLPSYMNIVTHIIDIAADKDTPTTSSSTSSTPPASPITDLTAIECMATLAWQQHINKCPPKGKATNKLSTVKHKGKDPKFQQQQQGSGGDKDEKKKGKHGKCSEAGQAKQDQCHQAKSNTAAVNSFTFSNFLDAPIIDPAITTFSKPTVDPCHLSYTPSPAHFGPPAFPQTQCNISLAHRLGEVPTIKMVCHLDPITNRGLDLNVRISAPAGEETISLLDDDHDIEAFGFPPAAPSLLDHLNDIKGPSIIEIDDEDCVSLGLHAEDMYFDYNQYFVDQGAPKVFGDIAEDIDMEYVLSSISHLTDTDERFYSPQFVEYILLSVVGSDENTTTPSVYCDSCD